MISKALGPESEIKTWIHNNKDEIEKHFNITIQEPNLSLVGGSRMLERIFGDNSPKKLLTEYKVIHKYFVCGNAVICWLSCFLMVGAILMVQKLINKMNEQ